jgi:hypothetical protein
MIEDKLDRGPIPPDAIAGPSRAALRVKLWVTGAATA